MKAIICILLLTSIVCGTLKLNLDNSIAISLGQRINLPLSCSGSSGQVNYQVKGLPKGLNFVNGAIQGVNEANSGYYPVIIDARDEKNNYVSQIVVIKIGNSGGSQVVVNSGQNQNTVVTTISSGGNSNNFPANSQQTTQNQNYQISGGFVKSSTTISQATQPSSSVPSLALPAPTTSSSNPAPATQPKTT